MDPERLKNPCFTDEVDMLTGEVMSYVEYYHINILQFKQKLKTWYARVGKKLPVPSLNW